MLAGSPSLKELRLHGQAMVETLAGLLNGTTRLTSFVLSFTKVQNLTTDAFSNTPNLRNLSISVGSVEPTALQPLRELRHLNLNFESIDSDELCYLPSLETFETRSVIPYEAVRCLPMLESLELLGTQPRKRQDWQFFPQRAFVNSGNMKPLKVFGRFQGILQRDTFVGLDRLETLELLFLAIGNVTDDAFQPLYNLRTFRAPALFLTEISYNLLKNANKLRHLDLETNLIERIEIGAFEQTSSLEVLTLTNNRISVVSAGWLSGLTRLTALDLSHNSVRVIKDYAFAELQMLEKLDLSKNRQLTRIDRKSFAGLIQLRTMDLSACSITSIADHAFADTRQLRELYLRYNRLTHLTPFTLHGLHNLRTLFLLSNELETLNGHEFPLIKGNSTSTIDRKTFDDLTNLESLHLGSNPIARIEDGTFSSLVKLEFLGLANTLLENVTLGTLDGLAPTTEVQFMGTSTLQNVDKAVFDAYTTLDFDKTPFEDEAREHKRKMRG